jgi:hypothetical protein
MIGSAEVVFTVTQFYIHWGWRAIASVISWSELLATDPEVPGSILGITRFSEKQWAWNRVHSPS